MLVLVAQFPSESRKKVPTVASVALYPFRANGGGLLETSCKGRRQGTPLNETPAHHSALCEHLGFQYLAQGYFGGTRT